VTASAILLIIAGVLALVDFVVALRQSESMAAQGALTYTDLVLQGDLRAIGSPVLAVLAPVASVGLLRARRWGQFLAAALGALSVLGAILLVAAASRDLGQPGSFAVLLLPPALIAALFGGLLLYATLGKRAYFQ